MNGVLSPSLSWPIFFSPSWRPHGIKAVLDAPGGRMLPDTQVRVSCLPANQSTSIEAVNSASGHIPFKTEQMPGGSHL